MSGKQNTLNRTVGGDDNATGTVSDTGGNLLVPIPVTVVAPAASATQITAGTRTLRATLKILIDNIASLFSTKANLASPTFTGTPAAPTATAGTNTTQLATTAFVQSAVSGVSGANIQHVTRSQYESGPKTAGVSYFITDDIATEVIACGVGANVSSPTNYALRLRGNTTATHKVYFGVYGATPGRTLVSGTFANNNTLYTHSVAPSGIQSPFYVFMTNSTFSRATNAAIADSDFANILRVIQLK